MSTPDESELGVSLEKVVERLCREPLGAAMWRTAAAEEIAIGLQEQNKALQDRVDELTRQKSSAQKPPDVDPPTMGAVYPTDPRPMPQPAGGARET